MHAIEVRNLTKTFGSVAAVDDVSFTVRTGRITAFLGPNGAGKSSTLQVLLGLATATSGSARIFGTTYAELDDPLRTVGAQLDPSGIHPGRSGRDHLRIIAKAAGLPESRVDDSLTMVGMSDAATRKAGTYSLGMAQRIGLAGAMIADPELLILDEPANGLDPAGMHWLRDVLTRFADAGGTVLIASHVLAEVIRIADDVLIIAAGKIVADDELTRLTVEGTLEDTYLHLTSGMEGMR